MFPEHASLVALVLNLQTGLVSPQFHVVFDDDFSTVEYIRTGKEPPFWQTLAAQNNTEHFGYVDPTDAPLEVLKELEITRARDSVESSVSHPTREQGRVISPDTTPSQEEQQSQPAEFREPTERQTGYEGPVSLPPFGLCFLP